MANEEQLAILKQGVEVWNNWLEENTDIKVDLTGAFLRKSNLKYVKLSGVDLRYSNLSGAHLEMADLVGTDLREANLGKVYINQADLRGAYLFGANLRDAHLWEANLSGAHLIEAHLTQAELNDANLSKADLQKADLSGVNLSRADLSGANLSGANLKGANFNKANLSDAKFREASLRKADLSEAMLSGTDLRGANLSEANLNQASLVDTDLQETILTGAYGNQTNLSRSYFGYTVLGLIYLDEIIGLETISHRSPSFIAHETIYRAQGKIPEVFLRGCGLSDWEIEFVKLFNPELNNEEIKKILFKIYDLRAYQALQISPLFISYSRVDSEFVDKFEIKLNERGIRFWRDIHDAKAGRLEKQIDQAIHQNATVLLILSSNSIRSEWVEHEVRIVRELEKELGRDVLCPVALDDSWKNSPWPIHIIEHVMEYNILDFSMWQDDSKFGSTFNKLIDGLELFYKG